MSAEYLAPHPWDAIGKPPAPGKTYTEPESAPRVEPKADLHGFTDATGRHIDFEEGVRAAARCILDQNESDAVEELVRDSMSPADILEWIVYPDTGAFADIPE